MTELDKDILLVIAVVSIGVLLIGGLITVIIMSVL